MNRAKKCWLWLKLWIHNIEVKFLIYSANINCMYTPCLVLALICSVNQVTNWPPNSSNWISQKMISFLYCTFNRKILLHQIQIHMMGIIPFWSLNICLLEHARNLQQKRWDPCITSIQRSLPIIHHCALCNYNGAQQQRGQMDHLWVSFSWPLYFIRH